MQGFWRTSVRALLGGAAVLALAACDNGPSAVAEADRAVSEAGSERPAQAERSSERAEAREAPVKQIDGKPMWSASRRYTADENAQRAFDRNGEAFGAKDIDDFVRKAHAFVSDPPKGAQTLTRANGDVLIYDAKSNVFAVKTAAGAPRTMFKPDDGAAYWAEQKDREARRTARGGDRDEREAG
jgi:pyocin large subunit-like protein